MVPRRFTLALLAVLAVGLLCDGGLVSAAHAEEASSQVHESTTQEAVPARQRPKKAPKRRVLEKTDAPVVNAEATEAQASGASEDLSRPERKPRRSKKERRERAAPKQVAAAAATPADAHHPAEGSHSSAAGHGAEHVPHFSDINWATGLLGESDTSEPGLMFRPKGMPAPFLATLLNWGVLVGLIVWVGKKQLPLALKRRRDQIVEGMETAAKMKAESETRLAEYEAKLANISQEIERVRAEMTRAAELERERILKEAVERRARMERDARRLVETELAAAGEELRREVAAQALKWAKILISQQVSLSTQHQLFDEGISDLKKLRSGSLGGQA